MINAIIPKLPMRDKLITQEYYFKLGFKVLGNTIYDEYLMLKNGDVEIHFFKYSELLPQENYGQIYIRVSDIETEYQNLLDNNVEIHPNGKLQVKPWGQKEFSLLDPDSNLLTFGENI